MLQGMLHTLEADKEGHRIPIIVLAVDAAEADAIKRRFRIAPRTEPQQDRFGTQVLVMDDTDLRVVEGPHGRAVGKSEQLLWSRTFSIAVVEPHGDAHQPAWQSCAVPTIAGLRVATGAAHATFNVTHLLFAHPALYYSVAGHNTFPGLQHTHGHDDVLRVFTHNNQPLCGVPERPGRELGPCGDVFGMMAGVRGPHMELLHEVGEEQLLTDVCVRGLASRACVHGFSVVTNTDEK